jgi:O-antigen ligase
VRATYRDPLLLQSSGALPFWQVMARPLQLLMSFEFLFAMFVFGGVFKANPNFVKFFPVDPTIVFGAASMVVGIVILSRVGLYRRALVPIVLYFTLCFWILLSIFWTAASDFAPQKQHLMRVILLNGWVLIGISGIVAADRRRLTRFICMIVVFAVILSVDWLVNAGSLAHQGFLEDRNYQNTARLISAGFIVLFGLLIFGRSGMTAWLLAGLGAVFFFYTLLITGARAPLIGLVLGTLVMMAMAVTIAGQRLFVRRGAGVAALVAAGLIIFLVLILQSGVETWTVRRMQGLLRFFSSLGSSGDSSAEVRALYIAAAFRYWGDSWQTIIFGNGLLSFTYLYAGKYVPGTNPHNIPLEILCEFGLVGFAIFAAFVASLFRYISFRIRPGDHWTPVLIALCIAVVFFSVTSGDLLNMFYLLVYGGLLPAIHGLRREEPAAEEADEDDLDVEEEEVAKEMHGRG